MSKLVVCIFLLFPLFAGANDDFSLEFSLSSGYMLSQDNDLSVQQQEIKFNLNLNLNLSGEDKDNDILSFDLSPKVNTSKVNPPQYGNLIFNHYQQVFTSALLTSQLNATPEDDIQLHYLHFGSNYPLSQQQNIWISTGLGITYFSAPNRSFNDDIKLSMSFGVHKDFAVNNDVNVRLESRVYSIFLAGENTTLCQQLACGSDDSLWLQNEVSLSINFQF
ncbi:hypothetical protein [Colwellia piezophila]|uniref:hypothetical protein n=1 Tax=Colwellia piezophila TaxID=211668 RepID=UPI0003702C9A|nr:hypothetical protein [Colwellia piezophila]